VATLAQRKLDTLKDKIMDFSPLFERRFP